MVHVLFSVRFCESHLVIRVIITAVIIYYDNDCNGQIEGFQ